MSALDDIEQLLPDGWHLHSHTDGPHQVAVICSTAASPAHVRIAAEQARHEAMLRITQEANR